MEVGFGPGVCIRLLASRASSGYIAGVDPSRQMVRHASMRNADTIRQCRVDLRHGSAAALPFSDESFHKAIATNSMQVWPDAGAGLREIHRVLKSGGNIVLGFTTYSGPPRNGVTELLVAAGFMKARLVEWEGAFCALASKPWLVS